MCTDIIDWEGGNGINMQRMEIEVKRIVREFAEECALPLELDKEEVQHLRKSRKMRDVDRKYVK